MFSCVEQFRQNRHITHVVDTVLFYVHKDGENFPSGKHININHFYKLSTLVRLI